jgi:hypothetical protein
MHYTPEIVSDSDRRVAAPYDLDIHGLMKPKPKPKPGASRGNKSRCLTPLLSILTFASWWCTIVCQGRINLPSHVTAQVISVAIDLFQLNLYRSANNPRRTFAVITFVSLENEKL